MNVATADQLRAAEAHARKVIDQTRDYIGGDTLEDDDLAAAILRRVAPSGRPDRVCVHAQLGPRILFVVAADPGAALCIECHSHPLEVLRRERHAATTRDCDACGNDAEGFYEVMVNSGPYIIAGHVCADCRNEAKLR